VSAGWNEGGSEILTAAENRLSGDLRAQLSSGVRLHGTMVHVLADAANWRPNGPDNRPRVDT
jgi:hypothetical protein